ncbi:MAG: hypothetical protein JO100_15700 [Pseudonocardia sp.]|nr:hypothetical protein [Pseudonocardia sp.]
MTQAPRCASHDPGLLVADHSRRHQLAYANYRLADTLRDIGHHGPLPWLRPPLLPPPEPPLSHSHSSSCSTNCTTAPPIPPPPPALPAPAPSLLLRLAGCGVIKDVGNAVL